MESDALTELAYVYNEHLERGHSEDEAMGTVMDMLADNDLCVRTLSSADAAYQSAVEEVYGDLMAEVVSAADVRETYGSDSWHRAQRTLSALKSSAETWSQDGHPTEAAFSMALDNLSPEETMYAVWGAGLLQDAFTAAFEDLEAEVIDRARTLGGVRRPASRPSPHR